MSPNSLYKKILLFLCCIYFFAATVIPSQVKVLNKASVSDLIFLIILVYYLILLFFSKHYGFRAFISKLYTFLHNPLILSMITLSIFMLASVLYSTDKSLALTETIRFFLYITIGFILISEFNNTAYLSSFIYTFTCSTIIVNIIGLYQFITNKGMSVSLVNLTGSGFTGRVESTFGNPNAFGAYLVVASFPFILLFLSTKNKIVKLLYLIVIALCSANLLLTFSRNSWLSFAVGLLILVFTYNWKLIYLMISGGIIMLLIPNINARIRQFADITQNEGRIKIWSVALKMIKEHPLRGVGNGNFSVLYDSYVEKYPEYFQENVSQFPSHNSYLKIQSELGAGGTLSFFAIVFFAFKSILYAYKKHTGTIKFFYYGFLVSSASFLILNFFDNILFVPQVAIVFWFFVFLASSSEISIQ
ncbi:O-antigen ligase family protein [Clostridium swellfunianum]|uniref:O-antigen ligase family protein n=1 Tax=Clostridium swellfunianum TaxID=1367462 RepID=UPI00202F7A03|nr:O-antigen ligase family protein [Clostridium swellfunianum]MCM0650580.1 O-antigen ligase family protein [Clostridium swellfunianum]